MFFFSLCRHLFVVFWGEGGGGGIILIFLISFLSKKTPKTEARAQGNYSN